MMTRRDTLRVIALLSLATGTPGLLGACGSDDTDSRGHGDVAPTGDLRLVSADVARSAGNPAAIPDVVRGLQQLAGKLYGELAAEAGNLALSPYSIAVALAMTANGAGGRTLTEMSEVLGAPDLARYNGGLNALTQSLEGLVGTKKRADGSRAELALDPANQLFGQHDVAWTKSFLDALAVDYGAGMRTVDFESAPEAARALINEWTAGQTRGRIPEIIPPDVLTTLTRLVLVNAIYLKAPWETPFLEGLTESRPFHAPSGLVDVDTMTGHPSASLAQGEGWRAARVPYAGGELAMTIVLPDEGRLSDVEQAIAADGPGAMIPQGDRALLDLRLPKWTFLSDFSLKHTLSAMGMPTAFSEADADLLGMTDNDLHLYLQAVLHQAFIAVNEEGTEAAAVTAVVAGTESMPQYEPFHVDRPFLFVIHDVEHRTPLFLGRVTDPS